MVKSPRQSPDHGLKIDGMEGSCNLGESPEDRLHRLAKVCERFMQARWKKFIVTSKMINMVESGDDYMEVKEVNVCGRGLRNDAGENNCFLNVIIQSLWHLRQFRDEFSSNMDGSNYPSEVATTLHNVFIDLSKSSEDSADPSCLRIALSELDTDKFKLRDVGDVSEVLLEILNCLHQSYKSPASSKIESGDQVKNSKCDRNVCIVHKLFGMDIHNEWVCNYCNMEKTNLEYTELHHIAAAKLRVLKRLYADRSVDKLWSEAEMDERECEGCGELKYFRRRLSTIPPVFISVLTIDGKEKAEEISDALDAITTEVDIAWYGWIDGESSHHLVSVVCYLDEHFICFAQHPSHGLWVKYDDQYTEVIGYWNDVVDFCKKALYHPTILFFERSERSELENVPFFEILAQQCFSQQITASTTDI